ncbi:hypothetical protein ACFX13_005723 [Malus domestica]
MAKRSDDPNDYHSRTRRRLSGLNAVGGGDAAQGTSKSRDGQVQLGTKFATLLRVKKSSRQQKRKRREITAQGGTSKTQVEVEREITTSVEVQEYRQQRGITVSSRDVPNPIRTLGRTPFPEYVKEEFLNAGFIRPTPIQAQAWPNRTRNGVGIIVDKTLTQDVVDVKRVGDRIMAIKIVIGQELINVISAYAPQVGLDTSSNEKFWEDLGDLVQGIAQTEKLFI